MNNTNGAIEAAQTRALDESLRHGHDAMDRAETLIASIWYDVTGYGEPKSADNAARPSALIDAADLLASRCESMVRELERLHARITAPNVKSLAPATAGRGYVDTAGLIDRQLG